MTHGNPGTVLTTGRPVSYVRFAVLIPRKFQNKRLKPDSTPAWFFFLLNAWQLFATETNLSAMASILLGQFNMGDSILIKEEELNYSASLK